MPTLDNFSTLLMNCSSYTKWRYIADCLKVCRPTLDNISETLEGDELRDKKAFLRVLASWREKAPIKKDNKKANWRNLRKALADFDDITEGIEQIKLRYGMCMYNCMCILFVFRWSKDVDYGELHLCKCEKPLAL